MNKERKTTEKICKFCSKNFIAKSKSAKFCSSNCRQDNYLKNKEDKHIKDIDNEILELKQVIPGLYILLGLEENFPTSELTKLFLSNKIDLEIYALIIKLKSKLVLLKNKRKNIR